jgi:ABC-type multidrug transport system fused ATPase/permease subunit
MDLAGEHISLAKPVKDSGTGALGVHLQNVARDHGGGRGVAGITISIPPGQHVGVVGRSGAGKSTLMKLLAGLDAPDTGTITVGETTRAPGLRQHRGSRVAFLPQEPALFTATLWDNLTLFDEGVPEDRVRHALDLVGAGMAPLPGDLRAPVDPERLSAGEAALLAIARMLVRDPGLVILDEPTAHLDPTTAQKVGAVIRSALSGRTAVVVAHRLDVVRAMDRVLVLKAGCVVEDGPPDVLAQTENSWFRRLLRGDGQAADGERRLP